MNLTVPHFRLFSQGVRVDASDFIEVYAREHVARGFLNGIGNYPSCNRGLKSLRDFLAKRLKVACIMGRNALPFLRVDNPLDDIRRELGLDASFSDEEVFSFQPIGGAGAAAVYASAGLIGLMQLAVGDTTNISAGYFTGVTAGSRLKQLRTYSGPTTAPGAVIVAHQLTDGVTTNVVEVQTLINTANLQQGIFPYDQVVMPSSSYTLKSQARSTLTSGGTLHNSAFGEVLT